MDREDRWPVVLLSYWDCPGFDSNSDRNIAAFIDVSEFVSMVWKQSKDFTDEPDTWEEMSHHELNVMLNPGPHTMPIYVTCTWCSRFYIGMPDLPAWSELIAQSESGADTPEKGEVSVGEESESEW
eukprot:3010070-Rhodomonas_salina.1